MKHRSSRSYHPLRIFLCSILVAILIFSGAYTVSKSLFSDGLESYRIPFPITQQISVDVLKNDANCVVDNSLLLVNEDYPLPEDFSPNMTDYKGVAMDACIVDAYCSLKEAVSAQTDDSLYIASAARSREKQILLYESDPAVAAKPGCSEHEAALALDVYVEGYSGMGFIQSKAGRFVNTHCQEYGFIIRYPLLGENQTGISYEPWHIRYVGAPHASLITKEHLTYEEYIRSLEIGAFYKTDGYCISRQQPQDGSIYIPCDYERIHLSPDNTGCYIVTAVLK